MIAKENLKNNLQNKGDDCMKSFRLLVLVTLVLVLSSCQQRNTELLEESENTNSDKVALNFTESYVNRDLEQIKELVKSDEELESYAQYRVDRQGETGSQIYAGMSFDEALDKMLKENIVVDEFDGEELELIGQYSEDKSSYIATHKIRESREPDYYQIEEEGVFNSTFRDMYGADESFIIFTFEVDNEGSVINLNSNYEEFIERISKKENTYILRGEVDLERGE